MSDPRPKARDLTMTWPRDIDEPMYVRRDGGVLTDTSFRFDDAGRLIEVRAYWSHPDWATVDGCKRATYSAVEGGVRRQVDHVTRYRPSDRVPCRSEATRG